MLREWSSELPELDKASKNKSNEIFISSDMEIYKVLGSGKISSIEKLKTIKKRGIFRKPEICYRNLIVLDDTAKVLIPGSAENETPELKIGHEITLLGVKTDDGKFQMFVKLETENKESIIIDVLNSSSK